MNYNIRLATSEEAGEIAKLIMLAWPVEEFLASSPELTYNKLYAKISSCVASPQNIYSYENTFVSLLPNGLIIGALCGYDGGRYQALKQPVLDVLELDINSSFARTIETDASEFYLDSIGVDPQWRGKGVATALFKAQIERARILGHNKVGLIVDVDKPEAENLYLKLGFEFFGYKDFVGHKMKHLVFNIK